MEKDIMSFIKENGTGQEIPDPPKFINFCKGDISDAASEASDDGNYSVAQFQRTMNPAFRSSSPQPSMLEDRYDDEEVSGVSQPPQPLRESTPGTTPRKAVPVPNTNSSQTVGGKDQQPFELAHRKEFPDVPHNDYPMDGMTQFCRLGPLSERSSTASPVRPPSRDSQSEYSNPTSLSSQEPSLGPSSPSKHVNDFPESPRQYEEETLKKKNGFFQNHSPFRRKSLKDKDATITPGSRNNWASSSARTTGSASNSPTKRHFGQDARSVDRPGPGMRNSPTPDPVDPRASFQLNVGNNVFNVASPDAQSRSRPSNAPLANENDPIARALADLKGVTKQASMRVSADRYHGLRTPAPDAGGNARGGEHVNSSFSSSQGQMVSPSLDQSPMSRLGAPQPAHTSRQMQRTTQKYQDQKQNMFSTPPRQGPSMQQSSQRSTPQSQPAPYARQGTASSSRAASPSNFRSTSPRPSMHSDRGRPGDMLRGNSPGPYPAMRGQDPQRPRGQSTSRPKPPPVDPYAAYDFAPQQPHSQQHSSRSASPQPQFSRSQGDRPPVYNNNSNNNNNRPSYGPGPQQAGHDHPQQRPRQAPAQQHIRPQSQFSNYPQASGPPPDHRARSKSVADNGQFTKDGRPILHYCKPLSIE